MRRVLYVLYTLAILSWLVPPVTARAEDQQPNPSLGGKWTLNKEKSEDAREKMRQQRQGRMGGRGGFPGAGGGGGRGGFGGGRGGFGAGGRGGYGGSDSAEQREAQQQLMQEFMQPPATLTITQGETELTLDRGDGVLLRLHPGERTKRLNDQVETETKWSKGVLVVDSKMSNGTRLTERYALAAETKQLFVSSRLDTRFGSGVEVKRVFDAAAAEDSAK